MLVTPDVVLYESRTLHAATFATGATDDAQSAEVPTVCDVLRTAARKAAGLPCADVDRGLALYVSPDGRRCAVVAPPPTAAASPVVLLDAGTSFRYPSGSFLPPALVDGEGAASPDPPVSVAWSPDSRVLAVGCASGALYLVDSGGRPLREWPAPSPWSVLGFVALAWGPAGHLLLLTAARVVVLLEARAPPATATPRGGLRPERDGGDGVGVLARFSVKRQHQRVEGLVFHAPTATLVVAGDGDGGGHASSLESALGAAAAPPPAAQQRGGDVTLSVWRLTGVDACADGGGEGDSASSAQGWAPNAAAGAGNAPALSLVAASGRPSRRGAAHGLMAALLGGEGAAGRRRWQVALAPLGEHVAVVTHSGRLVIASLSDAQPLDAAAAFAGAAAPHPTPVTDLLCPSLAAWVASSCAAASWWSPRTLALTSLAGEVGLAQLPGYANLLGSAPEVCCPGAMAAAAAGDSGGAAGAADSGGGGGGGGAGRHRGLLVLEPVGRPGGAAPPQGDAALIADVTGRGGAEVVARPGGVAGRLAEWLGVGEEVGARDSRGRTAAAGQMGWRLVLLAERTPSQMLQVHLRAHDWGSALQLARAYALDQDLVYRARWAAAPVSRANIQDNLAPMRDRRWVVAEALSCAAPDYESARLLLNYALRETGRRGLPPPPAAPAAGSPSPARPPPPPPTPPPSAWPAGEEAAWHRAQRAALWGASDKLETYMELCRRAYDPHDWAAFAAAPLAGSAAALAAAGNVRGLQVLLLRHPWALRPLLLPLLDLLPETLDPRTYTPLLPRAPDGAPSGLPPPAPARRPDHVECAALVAELRAAGRAELLTATEELIRVSGSRPAGVGAPPAPGDVAAWYMRRALALDEAAGQLGGALALLELGSQRGAGGGEVARLLAVARLVAGAVAGWWPGEQGGDGRGGAGDEGVEGANAEPPGGEEGGGAGAGAVAGAPGAEVDDVGEGSGGGRVRTPPVWAVTLGAFLGMTPQQQLQLLMAVSDPGGVEADVRDRLAPFLDTLAPPQRQMLLDRLVIDGINTRPAWCVALVEAGAAALAAADADADSDGGADGEAAPPLPLVWPSAAALARSVTAGVAAAASLCHWPEMEAAMGAAAAVLAAAEARRPSAAATVAEGWEEPPEAWTDASDAAGGATDAAGDASGASVERASSWTSARSVGSTASYVSMAAVAPSGEDAGDARAGGTAAEATTEAAVAAAQLRVLRAQVRLARLLARHGAATPLAEVVGFGPEEARHALARLLAQAERSGDRWTDGRWQALWCDLADCRVAGALADLSLQQLLSSFVTTLLRCQRYSLAAKHLQLPGAAPAAALAAVAGGSDARGAAPRLPPAVSEALVVGVAQEVLAAASDLEGPELRQASECLQLLPGSPAAQAQLDTIRVLQMLPDFGVHLLPAQLAQLPDRSHVLRLVLEARSAPVGSSAAGYGARRRSGASGALTPPLASAALAAVTGTLAAAAAAVAGPRGGAGASAPVSPRVGRRAAAFKAVQGALGAAVGVVQSAMVGSAPNTPHAGEDSETSGFAAAAFGDGVDGVEGATVALPTRSGPPSYKRLSEVLEIARLLGMGSAAEQDEVRRYAAEMAACAGDTDVAQHLALSLVATEHAPAWNLAAALATGDPLSRDGGAGSDSAAATTLFAADGAMGRVVTDVGVRTKLLAFALRHCPAERLGPLTDALVACHAAATATAAGAGSKEDADVAAAGSPALRERQFAAALDTTAAPGADGGAPFVGDAALLLAALCSVRAAAAGAGQALWSALDDACGNPGAQYAQVQRLTALGAAAAALEAAACSPVVALDAVASAEPGDPLPPGSAPLSGRTEQLRRLLDLGSDTLCVAAETVAAAEPAAAPAAERAQRYRGRLLGARDARELRQCLPGLDAGRLTTGDAGYRRQVAEQLATAAGQAFAAEAEADAATGMHGAGGDEQLGASGAELYARAQAVSETCPGVEAWQPPAWTLRAMLLHARDPHSPPLPALLADHEAALLAAAPGAAAAFLARDVYPLLPSTSSAHLACALSLLSSALRAASAADAASGGGSGGGVVAAAVAAALPPLSKLGDLLERWPKALQGLSVQPLAAPLVAVLVGPCFDGGACGASPAAAGEGAVEGSVAGGGVHLANGHVLAIEAVAALAAFVVPGNAAQLLRLLKHLQVIGDMLAATDPARHAALAPVLRQLPPGLPYLALAVNQLGRSPSLVLRSDEATAAWQAAAALLPRLSPAQVVALGSWVLLGGPQPLPIEAVGQLAPPQLPAPAQQAAAEQLLAVLAAPKEAGAAEALNAPAASAAGSGVPMAPVLAALAALPPRKAALLAPLLTHWRRLALAAALHQHGLPLPGGAGDEGNADAEGCAAVLVVGGDDAAAELQRQLARGLRAGRGAGALLAAAQSVCPLLPPGTPAAAPAADAPPADGDAGLSEEEGVEDTPCRALGAALRAELASALRALHVSLDQGSIAPPAAAAAALSPVTWLVAALADTAAPVEGVPPPPCEPAAASALGSAPHAACVRRLRNAAWAQLQAAAARLEPQQYVHPAAAGLLELTARLAAGEEWPEWQAEGGVDGGGGAGAGGGGLVFARTLRLVGRHWPGFAATSEDVASHTAAAALFDRLLAAGASAPQLDVLAELLSGVWGDGAALASGGGGAVAAAPPDAPPPAQEGVAETASSPASVSVGPLSPLHTCWHALFVRRLQGGDAAAVLRALDECSSAAAAVDSAPAAAGATAASSLPVSPDECELLVELAAECCSAGAALALELVAPYPLIREQALARLRGQGPPPDPSDPYALHLLVALLAQGRFGELASGDAGVGAAAAAAALVGPLYSTAPHPALWRPTPRVVRSGGGTAGANGGADASRQAPAATSFAASMLLPHVLAQVVAAGRPAAAAALAAARLRVHPAMCTAGSQMVALERFLAAAVRVGAPAAAGGEADEDAHALLLPCSVGRLRQQLQEACRVAHAQVLAAM